MSGGNHNGGSKNRNDLNGPPCAKWSDEGLLVCVQRNQCQTAFTVLYKRHYEWIRRRAWNVLNDNHLADDVTQDAFSCFWKKIPELSLPCNVRGWLSTIAYRKAVDLLRQRKRYEVWEPEQFHFYEEDNVSRANGAPAAIWKRIEIILTPSQFHAVVLRYRRGLDLAEAADIEGITIGALKKRLHDALKKLRLSKKSVSFCPPQTIYISEQ